MSTDDRDERDDRDDVAGDEWADQLPPRFPGAVLAAGIIWVVFGVLGLINTVATLAIAGAKAGAGGNPNTGGVCCGGAIAIAFLVCGYQTLTGKAKDTRGNGIGSVLLGILYLLIAGGLAFFLGGGANAANQGQNAGNQGQNPFPQEVVFIIVAVVALFGVTLIVAGGLALAGRTQYLEWRRANAPSARRRREPDET